MCKCDEADSIREKRYNTFLLPVKNFFYNFLIKNAFMQVFPPVIKLITVYSVGQFNFHNSKKFVVK